MHMTQQCIRRHLPNLLITVSYIPQDAFQQAPEKKSELVALTGADL